MHPDIKKHIEAAARFSGLDFKKILWLDLETRSEVDLKKVGSQVYAEHPSTEIMCASFSINDDEQINRWTEVDGEPLLAAIPELADEEVLVAVHNAEFEPRIFQGVLNHRIPVERILDTAAVARAARLPGGLEALGAFFGRDKDMEGNRIMLKLSKPRRPSKDNPDTFWTPSTKPEDFDRVYQYCDWDVDVMRYCAMRMPPMMQREMAIYRATYHMNERGIPVDSEAVSSMSVAAEQAKKRMSDEIKDEYGFTLSQVKDVASFIGMDSVAKAPLRDFLKDPSEDEDKRRVALARQRFAKTSVNKLAAFAKRTARDGRIHDGIIYGGAEGTLRFSGGGIQPQNLPRGMGAKQDDVFALLMQSVEDFLMVYDDDPLEILAEILRGLITHTKGFFVGDFSQIEARILSWFAQDTELLAVFSAGGDPYKMMAAKIYNKSIGQVTPDERFMGKQTVLGCGYGLGAYGFSSMLDITYDVQIPIDEAKSIVNAYRKSAPKVVDFWDRIGKALMHARRNIGMVVKIADKLGVTFKSLTEFHIILPSKRRLRYYNVTWDKKTGWKAFGRLPSGAGYGDVKIYPGKLCGHIVQSTARDVICEAILTLDQRGFPLVLTVHDENVTLANDRYEEFVEIMQTPPAWLTDFPLAVDAFHTERYRK